MRYRLGIDVGTTNVKAAAFDGEGKLAAYCATATPIVHPREEWSEFEPEAVWRAVCRCVNTVAREVGAQSITAVGISAMAEAGVPLDREGRPLYNFIAWYDMRSQRQCDQLTAQLGKERIYQITGQTASAKYGITKLMWLMAYRPDICRHIRHWLSMEDYIIWRLTEQIATDYSAASRTMAFDIRALTWSEEILEKAKIPANWFSPAYPGGSPVGRVTRAAGCACGLAQGTCVSTGGHDHACAAVAVNILERGVVLDSMGTGEVTMMAMDRPAVTDAAQRAFYAVYPHCGWRLYRALTSNQSCGLTLAWFLNTFCPDMLQRERREAISRYDQLFQAMRVASQRHEGLFFLPMIRGTVEQAHMYGGFYGITDLHDRGDFIAAMVDGLVYEVKRQVDGYASAFGETCNKIRVVGGSSKSHVLMQRKADVQNAPVQVPQITEAACMGAALLGAVGAGELRLEEIGELYRPGRVYTPAAQCAAGDQARFERYKNLREVAMAANAAWNKEA